MMVGKNNSPKTNHATTTCQEMNFTEQEIELLKLSSTWQNFGDYIHEYFEDHGHIDFVEDTLPHTIHVVLRLLKLSPSQLFTLTKDVKIINGYTLSSKYLSLFKAKTETKRLQDEYDALENELLDSILN